MILATRQTRFLVVHICNIYSLATYGKGLAGKNCHKLQTKPSFGPQAIKYKNKINNNKMLCIFMYIEQEQQHPLN